MSWRLAAAMMMAAALGGCGGPRTGKGPAVAASAVTSAALGEAYAGGLRGRVAFEDPRLDPVTGLALEVVATPAAGVVVRAVDPATGADVAVGATDADGAFALDLPADASVLLRVEARTAAVAPRLGVYPAGALDPWSLEAGPVAAGQGPFELVADGPLAEPFNILEAAQRGLLVARALEPGGALPDLRLLWTPGVEGTFFDPASGALQLSGAQGDGDGMDDAVVLHEVGHWMQHALIGDPSPGGVHLACPASAPQLLDRRLAFSEAWASAFSCFVRADPRLVELGVGTTVDLETPCTQALGPGAEQAVGALLWDLVDGGASMSFPSTDAEQVSIPLEALWQAMRTLRHVPHFEVSSLAEALVQGGALTREEWNAAFGPLDLALPLPEWAPALQLGGRARGKVDASAPQDALAVASGFHAIDIAERGTLTLTLTSNPARGALWLTAWAPFPHGSNAAVLGSVPSVRLQVPVEPGRYLVQVRAQGDGLGEAGACYGVEASFQPAAVAMR